MIVEYNDVLKRFNFKVEDTGIGIRTMSLKQFESFLEMKEKDLNLLNVNNLNKF